MRTSLRAMRVSLTVMVLSALAGTAGADDRENGVPRYRLTPGQELKYHGSSDFTYENGSLGDATDWQVWVVRANKDGSWRLVARSSKMRTQAMGGRKMNQGPADVTMTPFDLFPDGRIVANDSFGYAFDPAPLFPRLPDDAVQAANRWSSKGLHDDSRTEYKPVTTPDGGKGSDLFAFEATCKSPEDRIYMSTSGSNYVFDRKRGLVTKVENRSTQGYGFNGKGEGKVELTGVAEHEAGEMSTFAADADRYFQANTAYEGLLERAGKDAGKTGALLARAESTLKEARDKLTSPVLRDQADHVLYKHKEMNSYYTQEAANRAAVVGHDAADWELKDLDGKTHSLKDYRGKVVVLDFWYRGCGWCIRAMPQVVELADEFRSQPVAVLGMNTDRVEKDARFVVDTLKLNYPVLKAQGVPEKYKVRGFPTLIIIDPKGKVADVHVGYSPTLREEVGKTVRGLLAKK